MIIRTSKKLKTTVMMPNLNVSYLLVNENKDRVGLSIYNQSSNTIYVTFDTVSNGSSPTVIIPTFQSFVMFGPVIWTGAIAAIRNSGTGPTLAAVVTEILFDTKYNL